jgi:hypothetical protein
MPEILNGRVIDESIANRTVTDSSGELPDFSELPGVNVTIDDWSTSLDEGFAVFFGDFYRDCVALGDVFSGR